MINFGCMYSEFASKVLKDVHSKLNTQSV